MLPDILKPFEKEISKYKRHYIKIATTPEGDEATYKDELKPVQSKLLGTPFFPKNKTYPKDQEGKPMMMIAQINFAECPTLESFPKDGILQLFITNDDWYMDDAQIIYHSIDDLEKEPITNFDFLDLSCYEELPIGAVHSLSFDKAIEYGTPEDVQFDINFDGKSYEEFYESLDEDQQKILNSNFDGTGHKIGGYAAFTQEDPRRQSIEKQKDIQLLQLDEDEYINFGDMGIAHIFIPPKALAEKDFSKASFYWDCY